MSTRNFPTPGHPIVLIRAETTGDIYIGTKSFFVALGKTSIPDKYKNATIPDGVRTTQYIKYVTHIDDLEALLDSALGFTSHESRIVPILNDIDKFVDNMIMNVADPEVEDVKTLKFKLPTFHRPSGIPVPPPALGEDVLRRVMREEMRAHLSQEAKLIALNSIQEDPEFINLRKRKMDEALEEIKQQMIRELEPYHDEIRQEVRKRLEERFEKEEAANARHEALLKRLRQEEKKE